MALCGAEKFGRFRVLYIHSFTYFHFMGICIVVETSRTKLDETDSTPKPSKKIIKPDLALLMSNSFDASIPVLLFFSVIIVFLTKH